MQIFKYKILAMFAHKYVCKKQIMIIWLSKTGRCLFKIDIVFKPVQPLASDNIVILVSRS